MPHDRTVGRQYWRDLHGLDLRDRRPESLAPAHGRRAGIARHGHTICTAPHTCLERENLSLRDVYKRQALAFLPLASFPTYCASKAFLHSWLTSLRHQLRNVPVEVLELSPPYVQTALTGARQATDPRAMPIDDYIQQVMQRLERGEHPNGELLLERDQARRWAERDGTYDAIFATMNPG